MAVKFDKPFEWTQPAKVTCQECHDKISRLATITLYGRRLCVDCYDRCLGIGG